jgi:pyruvate,water dikinase
MLERADFEDMDALVARIEERRMPPEFLDAWDAFMTRFGCRGPMEMDVASPRYADDPRLALRQMSYMAVDDARFDPAAAHERQVAERHRAYVALLARAAWWRRPFVRRAHVLIERFAGVRDTPKYHMVMFTHALRRRALVEGRCLVEAGRLDAPEHVFDLTFDDVARAADDPDLDLRARRAERTEFLRLLRRQVTEFPHAIDSRGRILRPAPRPETPGELHGMAVSPGVATGPVKVLRTPHEKPVDKGDVLVAYTTDPGWTPLFVNAAAVVLEVGGTLQHGAVVAREYGKPCVVGIERVVSRLRDGQRVEVDGSAGVVRVRTE